jgi:hypothetical protein
MENALKEATMFVTFLLTRRYNRYVISHWTLCKQYSQHSVIKEAILSSSSLEIPFLMRSTGIVSVMSIVLNRPCLLYCN